MPEGVTRSRLRGAVLVAGSVFGVLAVVLSGVSLWLEAVLVMLVLVSAGRAFRRAPRTVHVDLSEPGLVSVEEAPSGCWRGRYQTLYTSGPFCAFRVRDPARGSRVVGLFCDELSSDVWRRLQVRLRAEAPMSVD